MSQVASLPRGMDRSSSLEVTGEEGLSQLALLLPLTAISLAGQTATKPRPTLFIQSRQGNHPNGPDTIGHRTVSAGDTLLCMLVEVYDESHQSKTACEIRIADGPKHTLAFNESMPAPQDGEAYLECAGDKPRRCMVAVNPPPVKKSPDISKLIELSRTSPKTTSQLLN